MYAGLPPCRTCGRGSAAFGQLVATAPPCLPSRRAVISCRWDTGGDSHHRIRAKYQDRSDCHFADFPIACEGGGVTQVTSCFALRRQGLCSYPAHLWGTSDFVPWSEALGTPQAAEVM